MACGKACQETPNLGLLCVYCGSLEREERKNEQEKKKKEGEATRGETDV